MPKERIPTPAETELRDTIFNKRPNPEDYQFLVEQGFNPEDVKNKDPKEVAAMVERIKAQE